MPAICTLHKLVNNRLITYGTKEPGSSDILMSCCKDLIDVVGTVYHYCVVKISHMPSVPKKYRRLSSYCEGAVDSYIFIFSFSYR